MFKKSPVEFQPKPSAKKFHHELSHQVWKSPGRLKCRASHLSYQPLFEINPAVDALTIIAIPPWDVVDIELDESLEELPVDQGPPLLIAVTIRNGQVWLQGVRFQDVSKSQETWTLRMVISVTQMVFFDALQSVKMRL